MPESTASLTETASAVAALGACQGDIDLLDDLSLQSAMRLVREHEQELQRYKLWLATAIARRSDHTLGYDGLARRNGFPTPATFIQSMTGSSIDEATKLARMGQSMRDAEVDGTEPTAVDTAALAGAITLDCADAIRRGLGVADAAVTAEQLRIAAEKLIAHAQSTSALGSVTPEALVKLARQARHALDLDAIERGEKQRSATRYVRRWSRDGMSGGSWALPDEDGGSEIDTALRLLLARTNGGPRFPATDGDGNAIEKSAGEVATEDTRSADQILADGFTQIFLNGLRVDPSVVPGASRAAVRVIVEREVLQTRSGSALLEESLSAISFGKLEENLCAGGTVEVILNDNGTIDVGREQRLFTSRQRIALGVRDGGCRFPGCEKPPSWCEAHHVDQWARDKGRTDVRNGILLCRYHHMLMHGGASSSEAWQIQRGGADYRGSEYEGSKYGGGDRRSGEYRGGDYWLRPPRERDPEQRLIAMPSRNPLVATMKQAQTMTRL